MTIEAIAQEILLSLPQETRDQAESNRAAGERERWESGQLSLELIDELYPSRPKAAIRLAVGLLYHCSGGAVRDRERICRRVPSAIRDAHPLISFHYWRAVVPSLYMIEYVYQVEAYHEAWGKLPSVDTVRSWVKGDNGAVPVWALRLDSLLTVASKIAYDDLTPPGVRSLCRALPKRLGVILLSR